VLEFGFFAIEDKFPDAQPFPKAVFGRPARRMHGTAGQCLRLRPEPCEDFAGQRARLECSVRGEDEVGVEGEELRVEGGKVFEGLRVHV